MDLRVSSDEIRSYVSAQAKIAKQELPEESRRVVLRLPTDSVDISSQSRALAKGHLRVAMEDNGRFTEVTNDNSNPLMQLLDEGMSDIKQHLDKMKELTELMEDPAISTEDRYATQIRLVELEGELEKKTHELYKKYGEFAEGMSLPSIARRTQPWLAADGETEDLDVIRAGVGLGSRNKYSYLTDRVTGEVSLYDNYDNMIDKRTELRKEAIKRVMMRELDPEAWEKEEEKLREVFREEFKAKANEYGNLPDEFSPGAPKQPIIGSEEDYSMPNVVDWTKEAEDTMSLQDRIVPAPEGEIRVDPSNGIITAPDGNIYFSPEVDDYELAMETYVEERLAELEKGDYEEFNAMRISVMSAKLAEESGDFLESLSNQLTEQYQRFAAQNELIGEENSSLKPEEQRGRMGRIAQIADEVMHFLKDTLLGGIQKDTVREDKDGYNFKIEKPDDPMDGVRDIFAPLAMTPEEFWQMRRPDLFAGGHTGA